MWYQWFIAGAEDHHRLAVGLLGVAANSRATAMILSRGTPVIFSAQAGV
jgi:hypothetical protein